MKSGMARVKTVSAGRTGMTAKSVLIILLLGCAYFLAGLQHFVLTLPKVDQATTVPTDGIVVITGGQQRLAEGLDLLQNGAGKALLVSGVGRGVNKAILADNLNLDGTAAALFDCCVTLDFEAGDTRENAVAARQWATANQFQSLRLVTANYHMPRAKSVFAQRLPDFTLHYSAVSPTDLDLETWWKTPPIIRLLAREYAKYLTEPLAGLILTRVDD